MNHIVRAAIACVAKRHGGLVRSHIRGAAAPSKVGVRTRVPASARKQRCDARPS